MTPRRPSAIRTSSSSSSRVRTRPGAAAAARPQQARRPRPDHVGAERDRLHDVGPARVAAVHEDGGAAGHRGHDLGQHLGASDAVVELAAAVVGDVDPVHAVLDGDAGVLGGGDALEDERDGVPILEALDLLPRKRRLVVHAGDVLAPGFHEAPGQVTLATAVHGGVHRHAERRVAVIDGSLHVVVHELVVPAHVELEDTEVVGGGGSGLESGIARGRQHLRHAELAGADRGGGASARREGFDGSDGREHHGQPDLPPEERGRHVHPAHVAQHARAQGDGVKGLAVPSKRGLRLGAAHEVVPRAGGEVVLRRLDDLVQRLEPLGQVGRHGSPRWIRSGSGKGSQRRAAAVTDSSTSSSRR